MSESNSIVVFHNFNNPIEANIIKAKLDAYGIPCFLTQEHLTALVTPLLSGGIRLHIFERDRDRVAEILNELSVYDREDDDLLECPNCRSKRILNLSEEKFNPAYVAKLILQLSKKHYCLDCETEFDH